MPGGLNTQGAVDLAALAAQRAARERAEAAREAALAARQSGEPGVAQASAVPAVLDVDEATFQTDVVDRSMTVPVVIDFWTDWAEPSKQLSPLLEKLAGSSGGSWLLARVNVDLNPRIAQAFQVQSVPTVFVVWQGQLVPGFTGALPEPELRAFLDQVAGLAGEFPAAGAEPGEPGEVVQALDPLEEAALDALDAGDLDGAATAFAALVAAQPDNADARIGLGRVELMRRTAGNDAQAALAAADANPSDVAAQTLAADFEVAGGQVEEAIRRLVEAVRTSAGADRDIARSHLIDLFALLGDDDPRVPAGRTALANALF